jgi:hypothetical protein
VRFAAPVVVSQRRRGRVIARARIDGARGAAVVLGAGQVLEVRR